MERSARGRSCGGRKGSGSVDGGVMAALPRPFLRGVDGELIAGEMELTSGVGMSAGEGALTSGSAVSACERGERERVGLGVSGWAGWAGSGGLARAGSVQLVRFPLFFCSVSFPFLFFCFLFDFDSF